MNLIDILFSSDLLAGYVVHAFMIIIGISIFEFLHLKLQNSTFEFLWDKLGMPLYRALVILVFVLLSYPTIFGIYEAPRITTLFELGDGRLTGVVNILFFVGLLLPFIPGMYKHTSIVLLTQSILCCMFIFTWLAEHLQLTTINYFPEFHIILIILILAIGSSNLANWLSLHFGEKLDRRFHLEGCKELIGPSLSLLIQVPIIILYATSLGRQLTSVS